ncbi:adhesive domain-containing protein [Lactococcus termiticola]|uniref:Bacterial Ig domain-containing protein n=1 Tax=Lactococcus termiticola TaxID=2169526 RepID=A0A2R5HEF0_9LACT|nr:adhesive domain-containing protein [Lactococcus termiticola]GBG96453.1 hypothetical protein NtB2_00565 [Lactococcus termiticola]
MKKSTVVSLAATSLIAGTAVALPVLNATTLTASAATLDATVNQKTVLSNDFKSPISGLNTNTGTFTLNNSIGFGASIILPSTTQATVVIPSDLVNIVKANGKGSATMTVGLNLSGLPFMTTITNAISNLSSAVLLQLQDSQANWNSELGKPKVDLTSLIDYVNSFTDAVKDMNVTVQGSDMQISGNKATVTFNQSTATAVVNKLNEWMTGLNNAFQNVQLSAGDSLVDSIFGAAWSAFASLLNTATNAFKSLSNSVAQIANSIADIQVLTSQKVTFPVNIATAQSWYAAHAANGRNDETFVGYIAPTNSQIDLNVLNNYTDTANTLTFKDIVAPVTPVVSSVKNDSLQVKAEAGSTIKVMNAGKVIGTAVESGAPAVNFDGPASKLAQSSAAVTFGKVANGTKLTITSTDIHGNTSVAATVTVGSVTPAPAPTKTVTVYRLYNQRNMEHLLSTSLNEYNSLPKISSDWKQEGKAFTEPASSSTGIHRVYNPKSGEHIYSKDSNEIKTLVSMGWNDEGVTFYSAAKTAKPVFRLFNPAAGIGAHLVTADSNERDVLSTQRGWKYEGINFYALSTNK